MHVTNGERAVTHLGREFLLETEKSLIMQAMASLE
jgi:hypothetical protein